VGGGGAKRRRGSRFLFAALALLLAQLCTPLAPTTAAPATAHLVAIPETPVGDQLLWTLDQVNQSARGLSQDEVKERVAGRFLKSFSAKNVISTFKQLGYLAPMTVGRFEGPVLSDHVAVVLVTGTGQDWRLTLGLDHGRAHKIDLLYFEPLYLPDLPKSPPKSFKGLNARIDKIAPMAGFIAAEVKDGQCLPLTPGLNADQPLAIASSFKLYVLGELARQISAGQASWDEYLALRDDWKSLPSGDYVYQAAGTVYTLEQFADAMISHSDNSATDHLIFRLGRENVEANLAEMGHAQPELDTPLLATREWFAMRIRFTDKNLQRYSDADPSLRRRILEKDADPTADTLTLEELWPGPKWSQSVEWFASPSDLCRAMAYLQDQGQQPGMSPVLDALSINPGIPFDATTWRYVGFKEGYETGVKSYVWLLQRSDGRWFTIAAIINDPKKEIDAPMLARLMMTATDILAGVE
jgi:beta-lactamase class A